jgi:2-succinyl-6-hydroxy-2,4-cyclohexadiene-1-carboxylate synthase
MRLNGLDFHVETEGSGPALVLLHGFTGSLRAWDDIRSKLQGTVTVVAIDLIGHGDSEVPADPARYTLDHAADDLNALLDALGVDSAGVLGYSMGGRLALHFAVQHPQRVRTLILESASPGIEDQAERERRAASDDDLAERILERGVVAFVEEWERQPLLALAPHVSHEVRERQHAQRLLNSPVGLANSLRGMGAGQQLPLWSRLHALRMPVQLIVGALDQRYCAVSKRMLGLLPNARLEVVPEAGHTVHLDQPELFATTVSTALSMPADCTFATN